MELRGLKVNEKRGSLTSVRGFPLHDDFEANPDQPVRFSGVGDIKAIVPRRTQAGVWVLTYEVAVTEVEIDPL